MVEKRKKLSEVFPDLTGIFTAFDDNEIVMPWDEEISNTLLDIEYYGNISGEKFISPLVRKMLDTEGELPETELNKLAYLATGMYIKKWTALWNALNEEYNPLNNYDMTEEMTDDETVREYGKTTTRTPTLTHTKTGSEANSPNVTETETPNVTRTDKVRGFNSTTDVPSGSATSSGTRTTTRTGTDTTWYGITEEDTGSDVHADSGEDTTTRNYALTFSGRVGNFAPADLLIKEWEFRKNEYFRTVIFPDVDKILTLPIY